MAKQYQPKTNYSLRRRFFSMFGQPLEWTDYGHGIFDLETVQRQIRTLASVNRKVEIELKYDGTLRDYEGKITNKSLIYHKK